ncbi:GlcG/HbpS family heme-binding protein [Oceanospirillum sanctuarii]|uniref:GlcG/HbpS family heme-binding protein n=1 Tax=Oceanospirillum sanctuarii TaxID=1434821 RepID=UPI000A36D65C|nr:heme-binding protein [Oceanospirillum sanctuarii]
MQSKLTFKMALAGLTLIAGSAMAANTTTQTTLLTTDAAVQLVNDALQSCRADGYAVSVSVVDRSGNLIAMARNEMAGPHTISSSYQKAFTAASMGQDTGKLAKVIAEKPFLEGLRDMNDNLLMLPGGLPVSVDGFRVAGIGVGGAPGGHLDAKCAQDAIAKLK